jgi:hypothetical protein
LVGSAAALHFPFYGIRAPNLKYWSPHHYL